MLLEQGLKRLAYLLGDHVDCGLRERADHLEVVAAAVLGQCIGLQAGVNCCTLFLTLLSRLCKLLYTF